MQQYRIIGKGGLHDIIREILHDAAGYDGYYDNKKGEGPFYRGTFSDVSFDEVQGFILGFASIRNMLRREKLFNDYLVMNGIPVNAISDKAHLFKSAKIGQGNIICPMAQIGANVVMSSNCILFSNSTIEHDCILGSNVNIAPGVSFGGSCRVGNNVFIGLGSVIKDGVTIGSNAVIGAGSLVLDPVPDNCIVYGSPARVIGENKLYERIS